MLHQMRLKLSVLTFIAAFSAAPLYAAPALQLIADGLVNPLFFTSTPDGKRIVLEQEGRIALLNASGTGNTTFMTVPRIVSGGEKGLLGLAFDPNFATNRRFFVNVTAADRQGRLVTEIRRYTTFANDPTKGNPASGITIMRFLQPFENHNGGWLGFGKDGFLYIATGDGGSGNDPQNNAQNLKNKLGKILRIDVSGAGFRIPADNPFIAMRGAQKSIFAYGLRNPFRTSFDRLTGDLYIGDVGQGSREEISKIPAGTKGQNFGWRVREGKIATPGITDPALANSVEPIYDYPHGGNANIGQGSSVTGGYVYRGPAPSLGGKYIFGDFVTGGLWSIATNGTGFNNLTGLLSSFGGANISSFGEDATGNLYLVDYRGRVFKFIEN
jgi:glucose/arabinose dehydrogenase